MNLLRVRVLVCLCMLSLLGGCAVSSRPGSTPQNQRPSTQNAQAAASYYRLGLAYVQKGRFEVAQEKLRHSLRLQPLPATYNALAVVYEQLHNNGLAQQTYQQLINKFPRYERGYVNYVIFLCSNQRFDEMRGVLQTMKSAGAHLRELALLAEGDCLVRNGDMDKAQLRYDEVLSADVHNAGALLPLTEIALRQGRLSAAQKYIETVNNFVGYTPYSVYLAMRVYEAQQKREPMRKMREMLLSRFARSSYAQRLKR